MDLEQRNSALRLHVGQAFSLVFNQEFALPADASRHAQVRRVQPGTLLVLFDGQGLEWAATVISVSRSQVTVRVGESAPGTGELATAVTLAVVMPANERMDALVEKATELGAASLVPLMSERSVLRLSGERAARRQAHWQAVAVAACEQCGRARLPVVAPVQDLAAWLAGRGVAQAQEQRWLLSFRGNAQAIASVLVQPPALLTVLSGPEGGLSADEEALALKAGFAPVSLGPRVLRADTAPLAALGWLGLQWA